MDDAQHFPTGMRGAPKRGQLCLRFVTFSQFKEDVTVTKVHMLACVARDCKVQTCIVWDRLQKITAPLSRTRIWDYVPLDMQQYIS